MDLYSVLVTGGNRGIGLELVKQLLNLETPPKHIFATFRSSQNLKELKDLRDQQNDKTSLHLIQMDVTNNSEIKNAKQIIEEVVKENGLTLLINNAGVAQKQEFPEITTDFLNFHFSTNTAGPIMVTQIMYPLLRASAARFEGDEMSFSRAGVLNISSFTSSITNTGLEFTEDLAVPSYKISKAALNMSMRIIAAHGRKDKVLVIMMCPGWVKTDMGTERGQLEPQESISAMLGTLPKLNQEHSGVFMNRFGEPYQF